MDDVFLDIRPIQLSLGKTGLTVYDVAMQRSIRIGIAGCDRGFRRASSHSGNMKQTVMRISFAGTGRQSHFGNFALNLISADAASA